MLQRLPLSITEDVTETKIGNLDHDRAIPSLCCLSLAEDVGRLQVIVTDGRMLTVEERQS